MIKILMAPQFTVTVQVPYDTPVDFRATFRAISDETAKQHTFDTVDSYKAFLRAVIVRLDDLVDEADQVVPFTPELLEQVLGWQHLRGALNRAYWAGLAAGRAGN